jgi:hypothetical protein
MFENSIARRIQHHTTLGSALENDVTIRDIHAFFMVVDTKCSSLLTHVSMMIAATVFLYADAGVVFYKRVFLDEIGLYVAIAILLLFCLPIFTEKHIMTCTDNTQIAHRLGEISWRRAIFYATALYLTIAVTVAVLITLVVNAAADSPPT